MIDLNAPDYAQLVPLFSEELGSVRDIYVTGVDIENWEKLLYALRKSPWDHELRLGDQPVEPVSAAEILAGIPRMTIPIRCGSQSANRGSGVTSMSLMK